jgi:hypothetical protein
MEISLLLLVLAQERNTTIATACTNLEDNSMAMI